MSNPDAKPNPVVDSETTAEPWLIWGIKKTKWYGLWRDGLVPLPVRIPGCSRRVWLVAEIRKALAKLPRQAAPGTCNAQKSRS